MKLIPAFLIATGGLAAASRPARGQDTKPLVDTPEMHYYDFWPGTWFEVIDGKVDTTRTVFRVRRSGPNSFVEEWRMPIDSATTIRAAAIRAWDKLTAEWRYVWSSDNGLFQVWDGQKLGADWYIVRPFDVDGNHFLSRQAWIPQGSGRLIRLSERSTDGGKTWVTRFRQVFERAER